MKHVPLSTLEDKILRPGFEAKLLPLLRFRGGVTLGGAHRMWNMMVSAMEHEATASDITQRLLLNPQYSQLCVPDKNVSAIQLRGFAGRLLSCPDVLGEMPHLEEYIRGLFPSYKGPLYPTPWKEPPAGFEAAVAQHSVAWAATQFAVDYRTAARWFIELGLESCVGKPRPDDFGQRATGKSLRWVITEYGVGYAIAHRWFTEIGLDPTPENRALPCPSEFASAAPGKSLAWAIAEYRVGYSVAHRWFDEIGVAPTRERIARPLPPSWGHFATRETNDELAERYDCSGHMIRRWRQETGVLCNAPRKSPFRGQDIVYPFLIHDGGKPEHVLLRKVNMAVPAYLDPDLRADICQDLMVGILCGDFNPDDLHLPAKEMVARVQAMFPTKYGPMSLDEVIRGTDDLRLSDVLSEEDALWANA